MQPTLTQPNSYHDPTQAPRPQSIKPPLLLLLCLPTPCVHTCGYRHVPHSNKLIPYTFTLLSCFNVLGTNRGPTDRIQHINKHSLICQVDTIDFLSEKHSYTHMEVTAHLMTLGVIPCSASSAPATSPLVPMVCVLPEPVCPYAKTVALYPLKQLSTSWDTQWLYTSSCM